MAFTLKIFVVSPGEKLQPGTSVLTCGRSRSLCELHNVDVCTPIRSAVSAQWDLLNRETLVNQLKQRRYKMSTNVDNPRYIAKQH